jgi:hypothetical protein
MRVRAVLASGDEERRISFMSTMRSFSAALAALAFAAGLGAAQAQDGQSAPKPTDPPAMKTAPETDHGAGASGKGDGSGMGQDTSEMGAPKGPGDKGGPPADKTVAPKICDDGRQPVEGSCPN